MFHHFPNEAGVGQDCLVKATELTYKENNPLASLIIKATQSGYQLQSDGSYLKKSMPAVEFEYSEAVIREDVQEVDQKSLENLPIGLDTNQYRWVDLDGEGVSGILTEQAKSVVL